MAVGDGTTRLTNDLIVPASIVVNVNNTICTCCQATLNKLIIHAKFVGIQRAAQNIVHKILPADWEPEYIEPVVMNKMFHLPYTICMSLGEQRCVNSNA